MKTITTKTIHLSVDELIEILSKHFGEPIEEIEEEMTEMEGSGQIWDDGPQPEYLTGITVKFPDKET